MRNITLALVMVLAAATARAEDLDRQGLDHPDRSNVGHEFSGNGNVAGFGAGQRWWDSREGHSE